MKPAVILAASFGIVLIAALVIPTAGGSEAALTGAAAFGDWRTAGPGVRRHISISDLPPPHSTRSAANFSQVVPRTPDAKVRVPAGFRVAEFMNGLQDPRLVRVAPKGDVFVAESEPGKILVMRAADGAATPTQVEVFASGLTLPFGIAFAARCFAEVCVYCRY
jgi:glucose/arabinose dehydrogenase